jgi:Na+-translocating ferredoxin:NAD+ oxidoreductase subunit G
VNDIFKMIAALFLTTAAAGFIIAFSHASTAQLLSAQTMRQEQAAVEQLFAKGGAIVAVKGKPPLPPRYWIAKKGAVTCGYAFLMETSGYVGPIKTVVGVDTGGSILGMAILSQNEAPGRGARMEERILKRPLWNGFFIGNNNVRPWFTEQFKGISVKRPLSIAIGTPEWPWLPEMAKKELADKNTISGISGATVTSRAVVKGIEKTVAPYLAAVRGANR